MKFTFEDKEYELREPTQENRDFVHAIWNKVFSKALDEGAKFQAEVEEIIKKRKILSEEQRIEIETLHKELSDKQAIIDAGGIKLSEAELIAKEMMLTRYKILDILNTHSQLLANSAEGQADDAKFLATVQQCLYNDKGQRVYDSFESFMNSTDALVGYACQKLSDEISGDMLEIRKQQPEIKFLIEYGFMDENLNFIHEKTEDNTEQKVIEKKPFLDDEGNPVILENKNAETVQDTDTKPKRKKS